MISDDCSPMNLSRRQMAAAMLGAGPLLMAASAASAGQAAPAAQTGRAIPGMPPAPLLRIAFILFPDLTPMDMVGPHLAMAAMTNTEVHIVWKDKRPVRGDNGLMLVPSTTFEECPKDLDILCVPGGPRGTAPALLDDELLDFIADRGTRAKYVTSVCTGSLLLGAAGLLKGYRANCYWGTRDILPLFGAVPVEGDRVVVDRNRITGGGVTAGIDFGLYLTGLLRGPAMGRLQELIFEYNPQPPFGTGTPEKASKETFQLARTVLKPALDNIRRASEAQAAKRLEG